MGITDGTFVCGLCGEWRTACSLCVEAPLEDRRDSILRRYRAEQDAERELAAQERAIRSAARPQPGGRDE